MNDDIQKILEILKQGGRPSVKDLQAQGYAPDAISAVIGREDVRCVQARHIGNGGLVTRLVLIDPTSGQAVS